MRALPLAVIAVVLVALAPPAAAKPRGCLTQPEIQAEKEVRHGLFLREAARRCDGQYLKGSAQTWQTFETANGAKFRQQNGRRISAYKREFPDSWQAKMNQADGRLVTYNRNFPVTQAYCDDVEDLLKDITATAYGGFTKQAKVIHDQVIDDYKLCR
jgi:hypothetical protein